MIGDKTETQDKGVRSNAKASQNRKPSIFKSAPKKDKTYTCMGLSNMGEFPKRLKLIYRGGSSLSIPYALLPLIKLENDTRLKLVYGSMKVTITGRGLILAEDYLFEERITWLKEHPSLIDDPEQDVFISEISMGSDNI